MAFKKNGLLTIEMITKIENEIGHKFPEDYRNFLLKTNGGRFDFDDNHEFKVEPIDEEDICIDMFYGVGEQSDDLLIYMNNTYGDDAGDNTIIIGNTLSGGFIVYTYKGADSGVFFWDDNYAYEFSGDECNAYFIAKDFNELMKIANFKME